MKPTGKHIVNCPGGSDSGSESASDSSESTPSETVRLPTHYYQQFDADHSGAVPADSFGGWQTAELELSLDHTALVVMHAWDFGNPEQYPGWYRAEEHFARAQAICRNVIAPLLGAVRQSRIKLFHIVSSDAYCRQMEGYRHAVGLAGERRTEQEPPEQVVADPVILSLRKFKSDQCYPGRHNKADAERATRNQDFHPQARPQGAEGIAANGDQLLALCQEKHINHLVYTGFAIDWCILFGPGGMMDMSRHGVMCSVVRQAVTAIENKETARRELCKELGLWRVAIAFGFVYDLDDFIKALVTGRPT